jgi:hypothetical protein
LRWTLLFSNTDGVGKKRMRRELGEEDGTTVVEAKRDRDRLSERPS